MTSDEAIRTLGFWAVFAQRFPGRKTVAGLVAAIEDVLMEHDEERKRSLQPPPLANPA